MKRTNTKYGVFLGLSLPVGAALAVLVCACRPTTAADAPAADPAAAQPAGDMVPLILNLPAAAFVDTATGNVVGTSTITTEAALVTAIQNAQAGK